MSFQKKIDEPLTELFFYKASGRSNRQLRVCQALGLTVGGLFLFRAVQWQILERVFSLSLLIICCCFSLWFSFKQQREPAVQAFISGYSIAAAIAIYSSGGVHTIAAAWLLMLPCLSALLGGKKIFTQWAIVTMLAVLLIVVLNLFGYGLENKTPVAFRHSQNYFHAVFQLLLLSLTIYAFFSQFEEYEQRIKQQVRRVEKEVLSRRAAELLALESNKAKTRFLSNVSHQLRTPLNSILGYSRRLILRDSLTQEKQKDVLESIYRNGKTLLKVVNDLIDLSNLDSEDQHLNWQPAELSGIVEREMEKVIEHSDEGLCEVELQRLERFQMIGDLVKLPKIFNLLFDFFVRNTSASKMVLACYIEDTWGCVSMEVQGSGVARSVLHELLHIDGEGSIVATVDSGVTGLSLAIVSRLVSLHQGKILLSEADEGELLIKIYLPSVPVLTGPASI